MSRLIMRILSLFLVVYVALSAVAAPLPVVKTRDTTSQHHCPSNDCSAPFPNHLSSPRLPLHTNGFAPGVLLPLPQASRRDTLTAHLKDLARRAKVQTHAAAAGHSTGPHITPSHSSAPNVEQMKGHLKVEPDKSFFYSGKGGFAKAARTRAKGMGRTILRDAWWDHQKNIQSTSWQDEQVKNLSPDEADKFFDNASKAHAEMSSGTVYVLLPPDMVEPKKFHPTSVWARIEWPALLSNPNVKKVIMVNPNDTLEKVLYDKSSTAHSTSLAL
ncbi:hypothetical protein J132_06231 [Termitomyces sp. J132]|nr:hypothetical protein J132_06231 [Termitomyces sp. J132]